MTRGKHAGFNQFFNGCWFALLKYAAGAGIAVTQHLLDQCREFFRLLANQCAVASDLSGLGGKVTAQIVSSSANNSQRSTQFVGNAGNEVHLQLGEILRAAGKTYQRVSRGKNE